MTTRPPLLCLVVDRTLRDDLAPAVRDAVAAGVDRVQLRERTLEGRAWLAWATAIAQAARSGAEERGGRVELVVNRWLDLALCLGADGAHLGFDAVSPRDARTLLGDEAAIGVSAHSPDEVARAARDGASYAHLAPIFAPLSKEATRPALGEAALREAASHGIAVIAQGGITPERCEAVVHAGADGVAVTGAILQAAQPGEVAGALRRALDDASR